MGKWLAAVVGGALVCGAGVAAEEVVIIEEIPAAALQPAEPMEYESLMICIWEDAPDVQMTTTTSGVKIGVLGSFGAPVYGVEAAVICGGSDEVYGFKGSLAYTIGKNLDGLGLAPVNYVEKFSGVQIGAVNIADEGMVQFGLVNVMKNGFLPFFPVVNFAWK